MDASNLAASQPRPPSPSRLIDSSSHVIDASSRLLSSSSRLLASSPGHAARPSEVELDTRGTRGHGCHPAASYRPNPDPSTNPAASYRPDSRSHGYSPAASYYPAPYQHAAARQPAPSHPAPYMHASPRRAEDGFEYTTSPSRHVASPSRSSLRGSSAVAVSSAVASAWAEPAFGAYDGAYPVQKRLSPSRCRR